MLTNCALIAVTSNLFGWLSETVGSVGVVLICIAWEHIMILIKYIIQSSSKKLPQAVINALKEEKLKAARRRNENLVLRHRRSARSLGEDCQREESKPNTSHEDGVVSDVHQPLTTILSTDNESHQDNFSMEEKENVPANLPIPKSVPEECEKTNESHSTIRKDSLLKSNVCVDITSPKMTDGVKEIVHRIEKQESQRQINPALFRTENIKGLSSPINLADKVHENDCLDLTPVEMLQMKKTCITPPRGSNHRYPRISLDTTYPRSNSSISTNPKIPTPRDLDCDLLYVKSASPNSMPSAPPMSQSNGGKSNSLKTFQNKCEVSERMDSKEFILKKQLR